MHIDDADHPELSAEELELLSRLDAELGPDPFTVPDDTPPSVIEVEPIDERLRTAATGSVLALVLAMLLAGLLAASPGLIAMGAALGLLTRRLLRRPVERPPAAGPPDLV